MTCVGSYENEEVFRLFVHLVAVRPICYTSIHVFVTTVYHLCIFVCICVGRGYCAVYVCLGSLHCLDEGGGSFLVPFMCSFVLRQEINVS